MDLDRRAPRIIEGFLDGDPKDIAVIEDAVNRSLRAPSLNLGDALDDVRQEALRRLVRAFRAGSFRGDSALDTYVYKVAHGAAIDHWRSFRRRREEGSEDFAGVRPPTTGPTQIDEISRKETRRLVHGLLARLGPRCRELLVMAYFEELPYGKIAALTGKSEEATKVQIHRCRRQAAAMFETMRGGAGDVTPAESRAPNLKMPGVPASVPDPQP